MTNQYLKIKCLLLGSLLYLVATAQEGNLPNPYLTHQPSMWEFGVSVGNAMCFGDVQPKLGLGTGFHFRKAIDYLFSIRGEGLIGQLRQEDQLNGRSNTHILTGSLQFVTSINNLAWSSLPRRRANVYGFLGGGLNRFKVEAVLVNVPDLQSVEPRIQTHIDLGFGISFRLNDRMNIGLEAKAMAFFGRNDDRLDGVNRGENDVMGFGSLRLNYNIGNAKQKTEPLYWVTPMHQIIQDVTELKNRPAYDPTDSDGDGVIDQLDVDDATPRGIAVDTRGLPLDSDGDGLPNYLDDEPFIHKNHSHLLNEQDVRKIVEDEMDKLVEVGTDAFGITEWFLPDVHFDVDNYAVRDADMGNLSSIARVLKANSKVRLVVTGFADKTASDHHNLELSYKRAKAVIDFLVSVHGLPRSRFVLHYNGEDAPLVPTTDSELVNRRVEFKVASKYDIEMENPVPMAKDDGSQQRN